MVKIPYIKIPSVRVGNIVPTSNIGTGGATPAPPTPITYLTQWKIVGNSEVHGNEIWSCGEYNATDGKYHILIQPLGGSIADIALTEPLRKVNDVADSIEFPSTTEGKAVVTRNIASVWIKNCSFIKNETNTTGKYRYRITNMSFIIAPITNPKDKANVLCNAYSTISANNTYRCHEGVSVSGSSVYFFDSDYNTDIDAFKAANVNTELIGELATPTTELVDAPQIEEADSYTCVISPDGKAVSWSSFETNSE